MLNKPDTLLRSFTASSLLFLWREQTNQQRGVSNEYRSSTADLQVLPRWLCFVYNCLGVFNRCDVLLVEEHISFCILDAGLGHLRHALVIKFIPQIVRIVPAVGNVVATWRQTAGECVRAAFRNLTSACEIEFIFFSRLMNAGPSEVPADGRCPSLV